MSDEVKFSTLNAGDAFRFSGSTRIYMKAGPAPLGAEAVGLSSGALCHVGPDTKCVPVDISIEVVA